MYSDESAEMPVVIRNFIEKFEKNRVVCKIFGIK